MLGTPQTQTRSLMQILLADTNARFEADVLALTEALVGRRRTCAYRCARSQVLALLTHLSMLACWLTPTPLVEVMRLQKLKHFVDAEVLAFTARSWKQVLAVWMHS